MRFSDLIPGRRQTRLEAEAQRAQAVEAELRDSLKDVEAAIWQDAMGYAGGKAGVKVTPRTAAGVPAVFACVRRITNTMVTLPIHLMRSRGGFSEPVEANPLYNLVRYSPSAEMTSADFIDAVQAQLTLRQNAYSVIHFDRVGRPGELVPVDDVRKVSMDRTRDGVLFYRIDGKTYEAREIIHLKANTRNGLYGQDLVGQQSDAIALAIALVDNAADFFRNGSRPSSVFLHPNKLSDRAYDRLKQSLDAKYAGAGNAYKTMLLEEGLTLGAERQSNRDSQMIEARKEQGYEIARIFGVPPHKVGLMDKSSFNNIEEQNREYAQDTIYPFVVRWELELTRKLLTPAQVAQGFHFKVNMDALLRPHTKDRYEAYRVAIESGLKNRDECRRLEGLPPIPDKKGEMFMQPMNYKELGAADPEDAPTGGDAL